MADIFHCFPIEAAPEQVFRALSTPAGLDSWWTLRSSGRAQLGVDYELEFGPDYDWRAKVSRSVPGREFELELTSASEDWRGTRVGFLLEPHDGGTRVSFHHLGWPENNEHYRVSCFCWAMYLRLLKRYVESGEVVPYEERLDA